MFKDLCRLIYNWGDELIFNKIEEQIRSVKRKLILAYMATVLVNIVACTAVFLIILGAIVLSDDLRVLVLNTDPNVYFIIAGIIVAILLSVLGYLLYKESAKKDEVKSKAHAQNSSFINELTVAGIKSLHSYLQPNDEIRYLKDKNRKLERAAKILLEELKELNEQKG